ncbi:uncharacterized protein PV07_11632 [Cladophialophora immunda]|uniref:BZIP domain-containing protein n=1 Tax=Cladophialophora immunda TaxID=569365 RepID=A0A0D2BWK3_9EURO|nr:uncharacterized protein PV07_11632 [Cladophialophora immunda]KIW23438.1 hypothetical protein PV07_11632 [Cladophialophora immunda]
MLIEGLEWTLRRPRRIRNRLAQRTTRERKAAYIQDLEKQVASYQRDNANLHVQDLMKEVAELRRALQKARSKLLSIATTANSSAESLAPHLLRKATKQDQNVLQPSSADPEGIIEDKDDFSDREQSEASEGVCLTTAHENRADSESVCCDQTRATAQNNDVLPQSVSPSLRHQTAQSNCTTIQCQRDGVPEALEPSSFDFSEEIANVPFPNTSDTLNTLDAEMIGTATVSDETWSAYDTTCFDNNFSPTTPMTMMSGKDTGISAPTSVFSAHLDCIINILRRGGIARQHTRAPQLIDAMIDGFFEECWPSMKNWLEITDSYTTIRWVLWWQVTRTAEAAADIPATNTPTPVQIALPHLSAIDWIPFPSIRNTLILSDGYDVDQVFRNMHKSFVLQKEFPVRDGSADRSYKSVTGLVQTALRATLDPSDSAGHGPAQDLWSEGPLKRTKAATSAYCQQLINFGRWVLKLDPGFFVKYPGLYDSSIVADGPCLELVNAPDVPPPKPLNMNAVNTYASLLLKDQNYHTYGMDLRIQHTPAQRRR